MRNRAVSLVSVLMLAGVVACSKRSNEPRLIVEVPAEFRGNFILEMGVQGDAPLPQTQNVYLATVPASGKLTTSTFLEEPRVTCKNAGQGTI